MTEKDDKIIELRNVTKTFGTVTAVDDVSLTVRRGEFVTLLGPSGCGKTTLLRMIAGFERPTSGRIFLDGRDVTELPPDRRSVHTVFQNYALFPHLNVFRNVAFGLKLLRVPAGEKPLRNGGVRPLFRKLTKEEIRTKVARALAVVGLSEYGSRNVTELSGGQRQRVAIARAIVLEPNVLLLDEPLGALDLKLRKEMQLELTRMHTELGITFLYVTHDQEEALAMSDTVAVIEKGAIRQVGSPKAIYDRPANAFVAGFIGESNLLSGRMATRDRVSVLGVVLPCADGGVSENEEVDVLIRPEAVELSDETAENAQFRGTVVSSVFKGSCYETKADIGGYLFTVRSDDEKSAGLRVGLRVRPEGVRIMKKPPVAAADDPSPQK